MAQQMKLVIDSAWMLGRGPVCQLIDTLAQTDSVAGRSNLQLVPLWIDLLKKLITHEHVISRNQALFPWLICQLVDSCSAEDKDPIQVTVLAASHCIAAQACMQVQGQTCKSHDTAVMAVRIAVGSSAVCNCAHFCLSWSMRESH